MSYASDVLADAPVRYYRLGESSGTTATDASTSAAHGTYVGAPTLGAASLLISDPTNTAVTFDGTTQQVDVPVPAGGAAYTVEVWFKSTTTLTRYLGAWGGGSIATTTFLFRLESSGNVRFTAYNTSSTSTSITSPLTYNDGARHHAVATVGGGSVLLYVDGAQVASGTMAGTPRSTPSEPFQVAAWRGGDRLPGTLDEFAYYQSALSAARVLAHYNAGVAAPPAPITVSGEAATLTLTGLDGEPKVPLRVDGDAAAGVTLTAYAGTPIVVVTEPVTLAGDPAAVTLAALDGTPTGVTVAGEPAAVTVTALAGATRIDLRFGTEPRRLDTTARYRTGSGYPDITVPVAPEPPTLTRAPIPVVVDTLPAPNIDTAGVVAAMTPTVLREQSWGRIRIRVGNTDVTFWRDTPAQVTDYQLLDPYGHGPATLRFPQITFWELPDFGTGGLDWLRKNAGVDIDHCKDGAYQDTIWTGHIDAFDFDDDGALVCDCSGELAGRMDKTHRTQRLTRDARDIGFLLKIALAIPNKRYRLTDGWDGRVGVDLVNTHGGLGTNLAYLDFALSQTANEDLETWTILPVPGRRRTYDLLKRDTTTVHATVYLGARGVQARLRDDQLEQPNRLFGDGVDPDGARWRGAEYPNLGPEVIPPYPYTDGRAFGAAGLSDPDTDTGDGISVMEDELIGSGLLRLDEANGVWTADTTEAVEEVQRRAGLPVTGQVTADTWRAVWGDGDDQQRLTQGVIRPLVWDDATERWNLSPNGSILGKNPDHDRRVPRIERAVSFGEGFTKARARRWLRKERRRVADDNWRGTITLSSDLLAGDHTFGSPGTPMSRLDLRAGMNVKVARFGSVAGMVMHVASVQTSGLDGDTPQVQLAVDTQARDAITLAEMLERDQEARRDPARQWLNQHRRSTIPSDSLVGFDREAGAGKVRKTRLAGGAWNVLNVVAGQTGEVQRIRLQTLDAKTPFAVAVFARRINPSRLKRLVPNPLDPVKKNGEAWLDTATVEEVMRQRGGVYVAGDAEQPCGYWPRRHTGSDGKATAHPVTGEWRDDASFSFWTVAPHYRLYLCVWPEADCTIHGRLYDQISEGA